MVLIDIRRERERERERARARERGTESERDGEHGDAQMAGEREINKTGSPGREKIPQHGSLYFLR